MRSVNLLKIAAEAEFLRQRAMLARQLRRAAFGFLALIFALGVLITGEIAAWQGLRLYIPPLAATLLLLGVNLVIAAGLSFPALRSNPTAEEQEALRVRQQALDGARAALTLTALLPVVPRLLSRSRNQTGGRSEGPLGRIRQLFRSKARSRN